MIVKSLLTLVDSSSTKYFRVTSAPWPGSGPDGDAVRLHGRAARGQPEHRGAPHQHPQAERRIHQGGPGQARQQAQRQEGQHRGQEAARAHRHGQADGSQVSPSFQRISLMKFALKLPSYENLLNSSHQHYFLYCDLLLGKEMFVAKIAETLQQFRNKCHNNSAHNFTLHCNN